MAQEINTAWKGIPGGILLEKSLWSEAAGAGEGWGGLVGSSLHHQVAVVASEPCPRPGDPGPGCAGLQASWKDVPPWGPAPQPLMSQWAWLYYSGTGHSLAIFG